MNTKSLAVLFLAASIVPNLLLAQFTQQGPKLIGTGAIRQARQGSSVAVSADGNTALVGGATDNASMGAVWVYTRVGGVWTQQGPKLVATDGAGAAHFGYSTSLSADGNIAAVGGPSDGYPGGAVWVFTRSGGFWSQKGSKRISTNGIVNGGQGWAVRISGDGTPS